MNNAYDWRNSEFALTCTLTTAHGSIFLGFGKKNLTAAEMKSFNPDLQWAHVKQIHSATMVEIKGAGEVVNDAKFEADALFTMQPSLGLYIKTADCLPVLVHWPTGIAAIHAGWRGVATDIIPKAIAAIAAKGVDSKTMQFVIGPHIQRKSFEVGVDVAESLNDAARRADAKVETRDFVFEHPFDPAKRLVDIDFIARQQIMSAAGVTDSHIHAIGVDTQTEPEWASYRRDGANAGRNLSFIARLQTTA